MSWSVERVKVSSVSRYHQDITNTTRTEADVTRSYLCSTHSTESTVHTHEHAHETCKIGGEGDDLAPRIVSVKRLAVLFSSHAEILFVCVTRFGKSGTQVPIQRVPQVAHIPTTCGHRAFVWVRGPSIEANCSPRVA
eukprot:scaffold68563_cov69-Phaeocystis_antarctica.AAC.4